MVDGPSLCDGLEFKDFSMMTNAMKELAALCKD
jgi:hypothetical protein